MKPIVTIPAATVAAVEKIHNAQIQFAALLAEARDHSPHQSALADLMADPSEENVNRAVALDARRVYLAGLADTVRVGLVDPAKTAKTRFASVIAAPLKAGIATLKAELAASITADKKAAAAHGQPYTDSFATSALRERIAVAEEVQHQAETLDSNPAKLLAKLGYSVGGIAPIDSIANHRATRATIATTAAPQGTANKPHRETEDIGRELAADLH